MIRGSSAAESGETGARSGWFVALSGKWLTWGTGEKYAPTELRGRVGVGVGAIRSAIGYIGAESWHIIV